MPPSIAERADVLPALATVFQERGYCGASLTTISLATGLGKGSLYHFFPGGKEEMASAVLNEIDSWFEANIFVPLRTADEPQAAIAFTLDAVSAYFDSGRRVCIVGAFALGDSRDRFGCQVNAYFSRWIEALCDALTRTGLSIHAATGLAEESVACVQGAIVLARALRRVDVFERSVAGLRAKLGVGATPTRRN